MGNPYDLNIGGISLSFSELPEDVQLCILSFLTASEIFVFSCTSKRFKTLCHYEDKVWFSMCERRWGSKTQIRKWGGGVITYKQLYNILEEYENLIGFWRCCGHTKNNSFNSPPPLVFFEWGPFFLTGSRVSPFKDGSYNVMKEPFLLMGVAPNGDPINFLQPDCRLELSQNMVNLNDLCPLENELVPVSVSFMGKCHMVIEEDSIPGNWSSPEGNRNGNENESNGFRRVSSSGNMCVEEYAVENACGSPGSLPDQLMSEIYQYFANRTSPGGNGSSRRQRRREKEKQWKRKWEPEHLVKIVNCSPTSSRPLQGLWKGICDDLSLDFYLVVYDDIGGISCRRVRDSSKLLSGYAPVFWACNISFIETPFSSEEEITYNSRVHLRLPAATNHIHEQSPCSDSDHEAVVRILSVSSSCYHINPDFAGSDSDSRQLEGRVWQYSKGTFGFGFLHNNYIVDLKHIALDGSLLDTID